ncbi:MFS transporter [Prauserella marina]|uniref:Predicted arabinose efflux permease, MFS family n=1 Tax=Prauserella marina TaxID=530584 RepID=A0A222VQD7_9PSEU|nr:MFS transporter [Prauserella marina]ASR36128.1 MFS transporter [Prauserella marina]PWV76865.1 putative MFS family arabinose efflux permease [Prauserella marina]SDC99308.1 Predicted arabinose efflux permease, MFS family [Prauserella marina]
MRSWYPHLCVVTALSQAAYNAARMLVSYRALALGGDGIALGVITALFALLPLVIAMHVGRAVDNGRPAGVLRSGIVLTILALLVITASDNLLVLGLGNVLLGFGQILVTVSSQGFVPLLSTPDQLDRRFAGWTLAVSVGQTAGLPIAGVVSSASSGDAGVVTTPALLALAGLVVLAVPSAMLLPVLRRPPSAPAEGKSQSVVTMLGIPGMRPAVFSSLVVLTSMDVLSAFLPVLGEEFGFSVLLVTALLTLRTGSSIVSRAFLPALLRMVPRRWLLLSATLCSALPMAAIPLAGNPVFMGVLLVVVGFFWGIGQPLTMTWVVNLVSVRSRASALSLRLTGNRLGQVLVPLGAGAIAGITGVGSVFVVTGALLWTSSGFTWRAVRRRRAN